MTEPIDIMADNQPLPNQIPDQPFVKKTIESPILDSSLRQNLSSAAVTDEPSGFKAFYRANKFYFWAIGLGVLIIAVLAYFALRKAPPAPPKEANVSISVDVPQTVASGADAVYKITVLNNDSQKLVNLQLELVYPDGATYENSSPLADNAAGTLFKVPDLIPGQNAALFVKAKVTGNVNEQKTLYLKLHYHYSNFNSEFIKEQTSSVTLVSSDVAIELAGPTSTNNGQQISYTLTYQNNSDSDINNARIRMTYPDGFKFASASPKADLGSDTWNVSKLAKGATGQIQISGSFTSANPGESKTFTADFLILGQDGQFFTQNSTTFITAIASLPLQVSQELLPPNPSGVINPGDNLIFRIHYQNNASTVATGVNIRLSLDSKVVDLSSIRAQGAQINNNTISWNAAGVPALGNLLPNQSGELALSLNVFKPAVRDASKNLTVVSNIQIISNEYQTPFLGNQINLKVSSPMSLDTALTFVSGQLPPQVNRSTTYKVRLSLTNSTNDFSGGSLVAFIPLGSGGFTTSSINGSESANVQFDSATGKLSWNVGALPANTGKFSQPRILEFQVTLTPSSAQANQTPTLVKNISFTAKDVFTGQDVKASADDITTADLQGQSGFSNGVVQP